MATRDESTPTMPLIVVRVTATARSVEEFVARYARYFRDGEVVFVGGGAGMAPILSLLRSMAERGIQRKATFFYGARGERDLCFTEELRAIADKLPGFTYIPALSDSAPPGWTGETGLITDVVKRRAGKLKGAHAYVCGPPPMVEAAGPLLESLGVADKRIYFDKFTTTGESQ